MTIYKRFFIGMDYGDHHSPIQRSAEEMKWHLEHVHLILRAGDIFPEKGRPEVLSISLTPTRTIEISMEGSPKHMEIADVFCRAYSCGIWRGATGPTMYPLT